MKYLLALTGILSFSFLSAQVNFADSLFARQEYYRAITEYQRSYYNDGDKDYCHFMIRNCYWLGEDYTGLIEYLKGCSDPVDHIYYSFAHLRNNRPDLALILNANLANPLQKTLYCLSCSYLGKEKEVEENLKKINEREYQDIKAKLGKLNQELKEQHYKSPYLAGGLAIVPGLGYAYAGALQTSISAFITNLLIWGSVFELGKKELYFSSGALAVVGTGFYLGNIYGSVNFAARNNNNKRKNIIDKQLDVFFKELIKVESR